MTKADETKARILGAALSEFSARGVAGARVDRIADAAVCNKNLLYVYFGSKEGLFLAVLDQYLARVYDGIPFTPDDLPGFAGRVFDFAMTRPDLMRLLAWSALEQSVPLPRGRTASRVARIGALAQAQAAQPGGSAFTAEFLVTTVMALACAWSAALPFGLTESGQGPPLPELRDQVVRAVGRLAAEAGCDRSPR